jgi:uncharacterized protein (TIGR02001 family)
MNRTVAIALAAAVAAWAGPAGAAEELVPDGAFPGKFTANVGFVSEYLFRGLSQTDDTPAIQGGFDWSHEGTGLYAGIWGSNVDFGTFNSLETDLYAGIGGSISDVAWKIGGIAYLYPRVPNDVNNNTTHQSYYELAASLGYDFGIFAASLGLNFSPDFFASTGEAEYVSFKLDVPVWRLTLSPLVGRQWIEENTQFGVPDYWHYGVSLAAKVVGFDMTLTFIDTDISKSRCFPTLTKGGFPVRDLCGSAVTFMVARTF